MSYLIAAGALLAFFGFLHFAGARLIHEQRYVSYYLIAALIISCLNLTELVEAARLFEGHVRTEGHIASTVCNRGTIHYIFEAQDGALVSGNGPASNVGVSCDGLQMGAPVAVEYLPADPSISTVGSATSLLRNALGWTLALALFVPAAALLAILRSFRNRDL